jgi:CheY-like chemotaxis protein
MSKILLAGDDFRLLATRAAVLAKTNASVTCCNAWEAMEILERKTFDLVVLCHSLSAKQAAEITERVHQRLPQAKILLVVSNVVSESLYSGIKFDATTPADPIHLIRETSELLRALPNHHLEEPARAASVTPTGSVSSGQKDSIASNSKGESRSSAFGEG